MITNLPTLRAPKKVLILAIQAVLTHQSHGAKHQVPSGVMAMICGEKKKSKSAERRNIGEGSQRRPLKGGEPQR